jgi:hypothetical protein
MPMRKLLVPRQVFYEGQSRRIVAIDVSAGRVELAPGPYVRDISDVGEAGMLGLQYLGGQPASGDIVAVADCVPRPDLRPDWPWATV